MPTVPGTAAPPWRILLCTCNGRLPVDGEALGRLLGLEDPPGVIPCAGPGPGGGPVTGAAGHGLERFLVGCCTPAEVPAPAPSTVTFLDLRAAWGSHPPGAGAEAAARLIRAAMAAAEAERLPPPLRMTVPPAVLIAAGGPSGLALAERLAPRIRPTVILDAAAGAEPPGGGAPPPYDVRRGRVVEVRGHLGNFAVTVEGIKPGEPVVLRAPQVVVLGGDGPLPRGGRHTGYHVVPAGAAGDLAALAEQVEALVGDFVRPAFIQYNPATCAAGSAEFQGCGICIPACPYDALRREGRRIAVDERACEGCGACAALCPTSSLRFTEPSEAALYARLRALLAPLSVGAGGGRPVVIFHCPEEGAGILRRGAEAGASLPGHLLPFPLPCLRLASESLLLETFRLGAAGAALLGCEACSHGERDVLFGKLDLVRTVLDAFGLGRGRVRLVTGTAEGFAEPLGALARFAEEVEPSPVRFPGDRGGALDNRSVVARAVAGLMEATGREPGRVRLGTPQPYGRIEVDARGCTLCGACAFVCPTRAITRDERRNVIEFTPMRCVACGMCEPACPEHVITLHRELFLEGAAQRPQVLAEDRMVACPRCGKEHINRRALETIEARVLGLAALGDTFAGDRRNLLRMCPECRAAAAVLEMQKGWEP